MSKAPICPSCDVQLVLRKWWDGKPFYGCPNYPSCTEMAPHEDTEYGECKDENCKCELCSSQDDL